MSRRPFLQLAAGLAVASLSLAPLEVQAGGCGCEGPSSTVYHVHQRCGHHCRSCPPTGMIVQSAPMMAAPMMAAPMMAAPMMAAPTMAAPVMAAPMMTVAAPQMQLAPVAAPQFQLSLAPQQPSAALSSTCGSEQLRAAVLQALQSNGSSSASSALAAPNSSVEDRLRDLESRMTQLETDLGAMRADTREILGMLKDRQGK